MIVDVSVMEMIYRNYNLLMVIERQLKLLLLLGYYHESDVEMEKLYMFGDEGIDSS
jgi:hypothetical protein